MSRICEICGKGPVAGRVISRKGLAKKKGGVGKKVTGIAKRQFFPNLQKIQATLHGVRKSLRVCAKCLKAGKVEKATFHPKGEPFEGAKSLT